MVSITGAEVDRALQIEFDQPMQDNTGSAPEPTKVNWYTGSNWYRNGDRGMWIDDHTWRCENMTLRGPDATPAKVQYFDDDGFVGVNGLSTGSFDLVYPYP